MTRKWILMLVSVVLAMGLVLALAVLALAADTDIVISEAMFNAKLETNNEGEWIEIYNKGNTAVDLTGWQISDNNTTDTITATMCPEGSCSIPAGGCWLIAWSAQYLQDEFNTYTNPLSPTVQTGHTIFLSSAIGNGLANTADYVILKNSTGGNVDCVSWASPTGTVCSSLVYISGGSGADTNLNNAADGQSITNIQGAWYRHQTNGSPYNCTNTASGGSPTAITVRSFLAQPSTDWAVTWLLAALAGIAALGLGGLSWARRRGFGSGDSHLRG